VGQSTTYRDHAARCRVEASEATLENVRERCLRAEAAWLEMANREESIARGRAEREGRIPLELQLTPEETREDAA
jgi:hypothetical protein